MWLRGDTLNRGFPYCLEDVLCALTRVSRAGFYGRGVISEAATVELRDQVQRVALEWPTYGRRRITAELGRCGLSVNRKRVQRLMREDNLLCLRRRKLVATTDSAHGLKVYPNLAAALVVSGIDQLRRASCESFMKTLKCEEVYRSEYRNLAEARARIGEFLEEIYNQKRLHSSLGYCPPAEFERLQSSPMLVAAVAQEAV